MLTNEELEYGSSLTALRDYTLIIVHSKGMDES